MLPVLVLRPPAAAPLPCAPQTCLVRACEPPTVSPVLGKECADRGSRVGPGAPPALSEECMDWGFRVSPGQAEPVLAVLFFR